MSDYMQTAEPWYPIPPDEDLVDHDPSDDPIDKSEED